MELLKQISDVFGPLFIVALFVVYLMYESIKEHRRNKREKKEITERHNYYEIISTHLSENSSTNKEILTYLKINTQKYIEEITESQARIVVDSILSNSHYEVKNYVQKIIKENHVAGNEKEIITKIKLFISNRIHKDNLLFKEFKYKEKYLSDFSMNDWKDYLIENIVEVVIKEKGDKVLTGSLQNSYDSLKYDMLDKILS